MFLTRMRAWLVAVALAVIALPAAASAEDIVRAKLVSEANAVAPEKTLRVGVLLEMPPGWHTYYKDPGDAGLATTLEWKLPEGLTASDIHWPTPTTFKEGTLTTYGYSGKVLLPVDIKVPAHLSAEKYQFRAKAEWLACNQICIPESQELALELPVGASELSVDAYLFSEQPAKTETAFWPVLLLALVGGLVLNLMPCVLPVLSLKALAIVKKSGAARAETMGHGVSYTLGILASFAAIAALLISLQQAGEAIGWGYQMQSPGFVIFLIFVLFFVGLNLSGIFEVPVLFGGAEIKNQHSVRGSFFTGVLAALVATPCTAPFMATAVGLALTLPAWQAMLVFLVLGFGLALPFLLISLFPAMLKFLPKPGAWMEKFKRFLAIPMYVSVIWLLWVINMQLGMIGVAAVVAALLFILFLFWLKVSHGFRLLSIAVLLLLGALVTVLPRSEMMGVPYSRQALAELRAQGKAVYVDATAAWCITCQVNKNIALDTANTRAAFEKYGVTLMVADWTNRNTEITEFLAGFGYNGVPLNVFYPANGEPVVLPQVLTEQTIIDTISH